MSAGGSPSRRSRLVVAAIVFVSTLSLLMATDSMYGITYDEPIYQSKSIQALEWLRLLAADPGRAASAEVIAVYWHAKDEHPGFFKLLTAVTGATLGRLVPPTATWRTGTNLLAAACFATVYLFVASLWGRAAGWFAVGALLLMPRVFAHCHLAALDAPIMSLSFLTVVACRQLATTESRGHAWLWAAVGGVLAGLAAGTKLNAAFLPFIVIPWTLLFGRRHIGKMLVGLVTLGTLVFWVTWPWLWHDSLTRFLNYFRFHFQHYPVSVMYFGRYYNRAPWHYPLVMTAITLPPVTAVLALCGALSLRSARRAFGEPGPPRREAQGLLLAAWAIVVNLVPCCLPHSPKYGGVRLFLPLFPYVAVFAAVGFRHALDALLPWAAARVDLPQLRSKLTGLALVVCLLGPLAAVAKFTPYHLSYYNMFIGGLPGAVHRGMEPTYWGDTYRAAARYLAAHAPRGATIWIEPPGFATTVKYFELGPLRPDLEFAAGSAAFPQADYAVTQNKPIEMTPLTRRLVATTRPVFTDGVDGVPLIYVFRLRRSTR